MPGVVAGEHEVLCSRLRETVAEVLVLNDRLEAVIAVRSRNGGSGFHGKIDFSQPPWNAAVANMILDLHSWCRRAETDACAGLSLPSRGRGGSSVNTRRALERLLVLADGSGAGMVRDCLGWLGGWSRRARAALGEAETARRLPVPEGGGEPACPWCRKRSLRQFPLAGVIRCIDPGCRDEEGRKPWARLEMFQGEWVLRWMDGVIGNP